MITVTTPPAYPKQCPRCGEPVSVIYHTQPYIGPLPPVETWAWEWTARCWRGHLVVPPPEQLTLITTDTEKEAT